MKMADRRRHVLIHIGLHKTGTRYLQREVFGRLDRKRFNVNPPELWRALRRAVREPGNAESAAAAADAVDAWRRHADGRDLILSEPHISGDMYSGHADCATNAALTARLFPEAQIIYFVRNQADWLQSAYRQQLWRGASVPMHVFLNFYEGEFQPRLHRWTYGARTVEALNQRFFGVYEAFAAHYGPQRVHLFRQEDLRSHAAMVRARLAELLGVGSLPAPAKRGHNRSYSALAIRLFHPGTTRRMPPPGVADTGASTRKFPRASGLLRRLRRIAVQHVFDRMFYHDWDLLAEDDLRSRLDEHYASENASLHSLALRTLEPTERGGEAAKTNGSAPRMVRAEKAAQLLRAT